MKLTTHHLAAIAGSTRYAERRAMLCTRVNGPWGKKAHLDQPHALAMFLAQIMTESGRLRYVREIWGPTKAQRGYEGRRDLGNIKKGDGKRFMGRDLIQITGRANYRDMTAWLQRNFENMPDFEARPELLEETKYLALGALWYWITRVPQRYVDEGNHEMVTRRVNGGLNGYSHRLEMYDRSALVLLGYKPTDIRRFQQHAGITMDGISGPQTRKALHDALKEQGDHQPAPIKPAPRPAPQTPPTAGPMPRFSLIDFVLKLFRGWK